MEDKYLYREIDAQFEAEDKIIELEDNENEEYDQELLNYIKSIGLNIKDFEYIEELQDAIDIELTKEDIKSLNRMGVIS